MANAIKSEGNRLFANRAALRFRHLALLQNSDERPYIHLVDGGLSDNLGLYGVVEALQEVMASPDFRTTMIERGLRRIVIVVVNARSAPSFDFDKDPSGPGTLSLLMQSISVPIDRYSTEGVAALQDIITEWRLRERLDADNRRLGEQIPPTGQVPPVAFSVIDVSFEAVPDPALREYLQNLPTSFALSDEAVDKLRQTAAQLLRDSPAFQEFVKELQ